MKRFNAHRVLIVYLMAITLAFVFALTAHSQNVTLRGTQFVCDSIAQDSITAYTYRDSHGKVYPVYLSKKGKAYIICTSRNGKQYRRYMPSITAIFNRQRQ